MLRFHNKLRPSSVGRRFPEVWEALATGVDFSPTESGISAVKWGRCSIIWSLRGSLRRAFIHLIKTDQSVLGVFRSLYGNESSPPLLVAEISYALRGKGIKKERKTPPK